MKKAYFLKTLFRNSKKGKIYFQKPIDKPKKGAYNGDDPQKKVKKWKGIKKMAGTKKGKTGVYNELDLDGKKQALATAMSQIERDFGAGSIMKLGENRHMEVQAIHTGSISLDLALGIGGVPRGRIVEIFGPESSGKTTVALHILAEVQKTGGTAAFIDAEHALDPVYAKNLGVNINDLLVSQPDCGEDALEICEALARSGAVDAIVVDSVAALVPRQEIEGDMGQAMVGLQARMMSQAMRKLSGVISKSNCVVVFINQIREKVGVIYGEQRLAYPAQTARP